MAFLALLVQPTHADTTTADSVPEVRARMQTFVDQQDIAGAVTVIGRKDGIISFEAVGSLNLEKQQPMPKDAIFRIASMTKPITAIGIMMLVEEGKLAIEDPVEKHLPEFRGQMLVASRDANGMVLKKPARPIRVRDLLTHTSGMPGSPPVSLDLYRKRNHTLAAGVMAYSQRPLDFEPGSKWSYCNTGIDTLGRIIEVLSGQSYEDFLQKRIFGPLGMVDTTFYPTAAQRARTAPIYDKRDGKLVPGRNPIILLPTGARYPIPAGGLYSTGADLAKLYQAMLGGGARGPVRILSSQSVAAMTRVQTGDLTTGFVPGMGFGLGWGVVRTPTGVTEMLSPGSFGHGGAFGTQGWLDPKQDLFVILLIQRVGMGNADGSPIRQALQGLAVALQKSAAAPAAGERHLLYVAAPGIRNYLEFGGAGILVFDMDKDHAFVKRIQTPASQVAKPENIKGVCASAVTQKLYFSTPTRLYCLDLKTEKPLWEKALPGGCDRMSLTPDGKLLYVPSFEGPHWNVVDAATGNVVAKIEPKSGAHNTICGLDGTRAYLAGLRSPLLTVADTKTQEVVNRVGPFTASIRPFTVNAAETLCYVNVNGLLGFEIGDLKTGKMLHRVEVRGFTPGLPKRHGCPSHGVGLTPNEQEVWVCDAANSHMHVFDNTVMPPRQIASIPLREQPGWITFSLDGRYAYPSTGDVVDAKTKRILTGLQDERGRQVHSEKVVEIVVRDGVPARTGDQFGLGRAHQAARK